MRKPHWGGLAALLGTLGLVLGLTSAARSQRPADEEPPLGPRPQRSAPEAPEAPTLRGRLVKATRLSEGNVDVFLAALGPAIRDQLRTGAPVELPGLGVFRVVRVPAHRDLVAGRPALIPASQYVEFLPTGNLVEAANAPGAVPAETVPPFEYHPLPNRTESQRVGTTRSLGIRTR
jgi:nucleoid DNA-binding protein